MRASSPTAVLSRTFLFLAFLSQAPTISATAARAVCVQQRSEELAQVAACGDKGSLQHCFKYSPGYVSWSLLEQCFEKAGCTREEAVIEASFVVKQCDEGASGAELRRRGLQPQLAARTTIPLVTARAEVTTTDATTTATISLTCSTDSVYTTTTCPVQSTGTASGSTLDCYDTPMTTSVCASNMVCVADEVNVCMERINTISGAGTWFCVILLATVFTFGVSLLFFLCCRDRRYQKKLRAQKEALDIAKTAAAAETSTGAAAASALRPQRPLRSVSPSPSRGGGDPFGDGYKTPQ
ncbi:hypothetical protein SLS62_006378 [Diatrype stigma]|uniref:Uncharacterized protein n=1 Tax=Diatrype stigma TaxID=117547 RepID=A0AAN9UQX0_9PEZI